MSHEGFCTPLNSLLILAEMLAPESGRQPEPQADRLRAHRLLGRLRPAVADQRHPRYGKDRIGNDAGRGRRDPLLGPSSPHGAYVSASFVADTKDLQFNVELDERLPKAIHTDARRLQLGCCATAAFQRVQVPGRRSKVSLRMHVATGGWTRQHPVLDKLPDTVLAFSVRDTGIGIAPDMLKIVFEPFQRATRERPANSAGPDQLGLSISREIAPTPRRGDPRAKAPSAKEAPLLSTCRRPARATPRSKGFLESLVAKPAEVEIGGDYDSLRAGDRMVLIIERDPRSSRASCCWRSPMRPATKRSLPTSGETGIRGTARQLLPEAITPRPAPFRTYHRHGGAGAPGKPATRQRATSPFT